MPPPADGASITGPDLARAFYGAEQALELQREALNAINVFPVPDGDTGTNMSLTMRAACDPVRPLPAATTAADVAKAAAQGALMGARGNSGVILSQILAGIAAFLQTAAVLDRPAIAAALERGRADAYKVISKPREGTILTAITAAARAAAESSAAPAIDVLAAAAAAAQEATDRTPDMLPVLKEAGVVDAGAQGLAILLDGMVRALRGEEIAPRDGRQVFDATNLGAIDQSWLDATRDVHDDGARSGFCTEFIITADGDAVLDRAAIRAHLTALGDSLLVVGGDDLVRVHVHTARPEDALTYARTLGVVSKEKAEDMEAQFQRLASIPGGVETLAHAEEAPPISGVAIIAVVAGPGIEALFRSLGATAIVRGGQTMNPSAGQIRDAVTDDAGDGTIILPNNKNVILAAQQAARDPASVGRRLRVIPSRSIPQGVAALIAFNPEASFDENITAMDEAIAAVSTGEVTLAARATTISGVAVTKGQPIALIDGELALAGADVADAARACARKMVEGKEGAIITLYYGDAETPEAAEALAAELRAACVCDVEVVDGGQPHYPYLIGVE
jgi:DAK2 domain fusion protein YloV